MSCWVGRGGREGGIDDEEEDRGRRELDASASSLSASAPASMPPGSGSPSTCSSSSLRATMAGICCDFVAMAEMVFKSYSRTSQSCARARTPVYGHSDINDGAKCDDDLDDDDGEARRGVNDSNASSVTSPLGHE